MTSSSSDAQPAIETPCIGVCLMLRSGFCAGCARTMDEIGAWRVISSSERLAILEKLAARKAAPGSDISSSRGSSGSASSPTPIP